MDTKYYFIGQRTYKNKEGQVKLLTLLCDNKGNPVISTSIPEVDKSHVPDLPEVKVTLEASSSFNGRIGSKVTGIEFL
jgi:hypothetical protein